MYSWGVGTPQSDPNLKKKFFLIKALQWFLILFLYFVHFVVATKVFGMQHFSLFLSLWVCVCYTCVSIPGFKSMLCFIFYHSLWEIECAVHIVGCLPSICSPPPSPSSPRFPFGDLGFQRCWFYFHFQILSPFCWKVLPLIVPFLIQSKKKQKNKKTTKSSYWCCKAWCSGALLSNLISYSLPSICAPFYCPLLLFLKHSRHCYICQYSPTSRTLTLCSVRIKQLKTELTSFP